MGSSKKANNHQQAPISRAMLSTVKTLVFLGMIALALAKPWYQGAGLPDCAPGKCPRTAEVSPIKCSSDLAMFFNNGYPMNCAEGEECGAAAADAAEGNPCRPVAGGEGYERK